VIPIAPAMPSYMALTADSSHVEVVDPGVQRLLDRPVGGRLVDRASPATP
jgi:hypothetical protein